jgi:hypothetical protein
MMDDAVTPKEFMGTSQMDPMGMRMEGVSSSSVQELDVASNAHFQHFFPPLPIASPPGLHEPKYGVAWHVFGGPRPGCRRKHILPLANF